MSRDGTGSSISGGQIGGAGRRRDRGPSCINRAHHHHHRHHHHRRRYHHHRHRCHHYHYVRTLIASGELVGINWSHQLTRALGLLLLLLLLLLLRRAE